MKRQRGNPSACASPFIVGAVAFHCLLLPSGILAQAPVKNAEFYPDSTRPDVYVNESLEAADAIQRSHRLTAAGRWGEAAELLQLTSDGAGDRLAALAQGSYAGIRDIVNGQICSWPAEGLAAYRASVEPQFQDQWAALSGTRSSDELLSLFERYFCTSLAAKLADTIAQLALEAGHLALARNVYEQVLERHPDRAAFAPRYQNMLLLLDAMEGLIPDDHPARLSGQDRIRWMGQERAVGDVLGEVSASYSAVHLPPDDTEWPTFGGSFDRQRLVQCNIDEPALLWQVPLPVTADSDDSAPDGDEQGAPKGRARVLTAQPVTGGGLVVLQFSRSIMAFHIASGATAWHFHADPPSSTSGEDADLLQSEVPESVTIHDGHVYAALPGDAGPYHGTDASRRAPELICLNLATGRLNWRTGPIERLDRGTELAFDASPVVDHARVFVVGRRRKSFGFEDVFLYRFDEPTGRIRFRTHLGSASSGSFGSRAATVGIPALHGDFVYAATNLGTVASVSASTGAVRWLRILERPSSSSAPSPRSAASWTNRERAPWEVNPVIWSNGRLIVQPSDAPQLLVLNSVDGRVTRDIPLAELGGAVGILGVSGDSVCGVGTHVACYDFAEGKPLWSVEIPELDPVIGRGQWIDGSLLIPVRSGVRRFQTADGRETPPPWPSNHEAGNIVAAADRWLVLSRKGLSAYVRKVDLWGSLRRKMDDAPSDPIPALDLAEAAVRAGDTEMALEVLNEAVRRADAVPDGADTAVRRRLFDASLYFVDGLQSRSELDSSRLDVLFNYASRFPTDTTAHVLYRLRFGSLFEMREMPERALTVYQQILRDRTLREQPMVESARQSERAGNLASQRIATLINQHGPGLYAPFEAEAERWLEGARAAKHQADLMRVAESFPNSQAAPKALAAWGEVLLESKHPLEAAQWFIRAFRQFPSTAERPLLLRRAAEAFEQGGKPEQAWRWLSRGMRDFPEIRFDVEGRGVSFADLRSRLGDLRGRFEAALPPLTLPLSQASLKEFEAPLMLLVPRYAEYAAARWSRVYVHTSDGIRALDARKAVEVWDRPAPVKTTPELLVASDDAAWFITQYEVFALDAATGARRWSYGHYPERLADPNADWEDGQAIRLHALYQGKLIVSRDRGQMTCLDLNSGAIVWNETHQPAPSGRLRWNDKWVGYDATQDDRSVICLVDGSSGQKLGTIVTQEQRAVEELVMTDEGRALVVTTRSIGCYDAERKTQRWRLPVDGRIRRESIAVDLDSLYFSDDGAHVQRVELEDGRIAWRSDRLFTNREDDLQVDRRGTQLLVSGISAICGVDDSSGAILWRGTGPPEPRLVRRLLSEPYCLAVHVPPPPSNASALAFFYDHRNASGLLPKNGGVLELGPLSNLRLIMFANQSLWLQTENGLQAWVGP